MGGRRSIRVAFLGNDEWSVPSLGSLHGSRHDVVLVVTRTPRPSRRGSDVVPTPVAATAARLGLPLAEVHTVTRGEGLDRLAASRPDVLAVVAYGEILPEHVLSLPTIAPVNLHFSLLPRLRGASPVQTALLHGQRVTGVSTIVMDAGVDTGPILERVEDRIRPDDDAGSLGGRLAEVGGRVLVSSIDALADGSARPVPQDDALATFAPKLTAEDRTIDWTAPAPTIVNLVRALSPSPAATTTFRGEPLKVFRAATAGGGGEPGSIGAVGTDGVVVAAGEGSVRLREVAPPGRKRMSGGSFVNGFRPEPGERLG
jgi:methionyl-tRNA formyltransferase